MSKTDLTDEKRGLVRAYYVHGSGLFGFSSERINEIPKLKQEYHQMESKRALALLSMPRYL